MSWLRNIDVEQVDLVFRGAVRDPEDPEDTMKFPLVKSEDNEGAHAKMRAHFHRHEDGTEHIHAHRHEDGNADHDRPEHGHRVAKSEDADGPCDCGCETEELANAELDRKGGPKRSDLDDDDFAYIEPGAKKNPKTGKTEGKYRHYPIMDKSHVRNALARAAQALAKGGRTAMIARKALPKIRAAAKRMGIGAPAKGEAMAKEEALLHVLDLAYSEDGAASPLALALGEDSARAILALARDAEMENTVPNIAKADEKPTEENPDPDGDGDDDTTPEGDTDHDYWNADGTPTAKGKAVGFTAAQGKADLSKTEGSKMPTTAELAKSEQERIALAEQLNEVRAQLAKTEAIANAEREARLQREYLAKAESYSHLPGLSKDELATVLRAVDGNPEVAEKLTTLLSAANASIAKSELFRERGSSAGNTGSGSAFAKMEQMAQALAKEDSSLTTAKAWAKVQRDNPELYQQYVSEQRRAAREV